MRYILAMIFICAGGIVTASAMPAASSPAVSAAVAQSIVQVSRHYRHSGHHRAHATGGIHPLVGSGDY